MVLWESPATHQIAKCFTYWLSNPLIFPGVLWESLGVIPEG